ncbi:MAG: MBL fold metallo-hydrolase [Acidobacteriota bacterium]
MICVAPLAAVFCLIAISVKSSGQKAPYLIVLGIAQDGGYPQAGTKDSPAWDNAAERRLVTSVALVDPVTTERWLFEATPDFKEQLHLLDQAAPVPEVPGLNGIFLTHAHIGHYVGLAQVGHEAMGGHRIPVYAMPRMRDYLRSNGPWDQLVRYRNIELENLEPQKTLQLNTRIRVTPFPVPHRQEYSEVVGFRIKGPTRTVVFLPDIDSWEQWDGWGVRIEDVIARADVAYLDGTFFGPGEIPGRDMSQFPHPFISHSLRRFVSLPPEEKKKIRFIHLNHTNPVLFPGSAERRQVGQAGFRVAAELERVEL